MVKHDTHHAGDHGLVHSLEHFMDKLSKDPLATLIAGAAIFKFLKVEKTPVEKFFGDPIRFIIVILTLAGYIYFTDSSTKDKAISETKISIQKISDQMDRQIVLISQMQTTQERLIKQVDDLSQRDIRK